MARSKARSSDESDEDYLVGQDEEIEESEDECNLTVDEEDLDEIVCGLEEEFVEKKKKKVGRSTAKGGLRSWGKGTRKNRTVKPKRKRKALYKFVEDEDEEEDCNDEDSDFDDRETKEVVRPRKKRRGAHRDVEEGDENGEDYDFDDEKTKEVVWPRKKNRTAHRDVEEEEDDDVEEEEEEEEDDDEEEEEDDDDEDYEFDDERTKEVIRPRKKKRTAHRVSKEEDDDNDDDDDFSDKKTREIRRPREKKRIAHRGAREGSEENDEDYAFDDEKIKEVIIPRKKKGTVQVRGYIGSTVANSSDVKENNFLHTREKRRVSYREEEDSDNVSDNAFAEPRRRKRGSYTKDNEDITATSEEDFDLNKLKIVRKPRRKRNVTYREVDDDFRISQEEDIVGENGGVQEEKLVSYREEENIFGIKSDIPEVQMNNDASKSRIKKDVCYKENDDDDDDDYVAMDETDEDEEFKPDETNELDDGDDLPLMKENLDTTVLRKNEVSYGEDDDYDLMDDNDEDEEFRPDGINDLDDEECSPIKEEEKVGDPVLQGNEVSYREDDDDYDGMDDNDDVEEFMQDEINDVDDKEELPLSEKEISCREDDDDYDGINDDDEDDEFTPDEIDDLDDEEELLLIKEKKVGRPTLQETRFRRRQKRKRNLMVSQKAARKKPKGNYLLRRCTNDQNFIQSNSTVEERSKKVHRRGKKRRLTVNSDSDLVSSGSSDYEFTISEEEREQIREANELCRNLITSSRSSILSEMFEEHKEVVPQRKRLTRKGKEKVEDVEVEVGKQVCGICLTEEVKSTIRGTLNCCSHYFCFACIMEWSKVESRCPLCKQRFASISKPAKCNTGFDLRTVVIQIPERDQVYQPSEEELQGFLDPYDNVICTECHQGGDDALMLLCDLCDSPAHTYCVGLGREVPEGNWYCDGCRPTALGSPNQQVLTPTGDHTTTTQGSIGSSPAPNIRETFDLNEMYVPDTPTTQDSCQVPSPRPPVGDGQLPSPGSGSAALTVLGRRRIQRQIHNILNSRRRHMDNQTHETPSSVSGRSLFGFQVGQNREFAVQHVATPQRVPENNLGLSWNLRDNTMPLVQHRDVLSARFSHMREQSREDYPSTSANSSFGTFIPNEFSLLNSRMVSDVGHQQLQPFGVGPSAGSDTGMSSHPYRELTVPSKTFQEAPHTRF